MRSQRFLFLLLGPLAVLAVAAFIAEAQSPIGHKGQSTPEPILEPPVGKAGMTLRHNAVVQAINRVKGAVVNIHSERTFQGPSSSDPFALQQAPNQVNGMGTGIVIDPRGYIVTNNHVVDEVNLIKIRLADGSTTLATVLVRNRDSDLALLKINHSKSLPTMPLGTARDLMVGEDVIAIGNAFGYEHTITRGIVSAIKRDVNLNKEISYKSLIQTDASINPGNSGGPLINVNGDLIGVNVAIRAGAHGIGFAIPVDNMIATVSEMMRSIRLPLASDGMLYYDEVQPTEEAANRKVVVEKVLPKGAAEKAGILQGDVLSKVADQPIQCSFDVDRALLGRKVGDQVSVVLQRQGKTQIVNLVLDQAVFGKPGTAELVWNKLGVQLVPVSKEIVTQVNPQLNGGMRVASLATSSAAAQAGIRQGDILVGLHQWETLSLDNVAFVLTHPDLASFNPLSFYLIRNGQVRRGWIQSVE
jgi:serine protease Do